MLWRVSNEWQRIMRDAVKELDLTHAQFVLLAATVWLEDNSKVVNQAALSRHAAMDKMMVSDVVRGLEAKKLVKRRRDPNDGRSYCIVATKTGVEILQQAMKAVEIANRAFFSRSTFSRTNILEMLRSLSSFDA